MIRYALACRQGHAFESWFRNSDAFDEQVERGLILCPTCGSANVEKTLMAPNLSRTRKTASPPVPVAQDKPPEVAAGGYVVGRRAVRGPCAGCTLGIPAARGTRTGRDDVAAGA